MGKYEDLLIQNSHLHICDTFELPGMFKGFYDNGVILIDKIYLTQKARDFVGRTSPP